MTRRQSWIAALASVLALAGCIESVRPTPVEPREPGTPLVVATFDLLDADATHGHVPTIHYFATEEVMKGADFKLGEALEGATRRYLASRPDITVRRMEAPGWLRYWRLGIYRPGWNSFSLAPEFAKEVDAYAVEQRVDVLILLVPFKGTVLPLSPGTFTGHGLFTMCNVNDCLGYPMTNFMVAIIDTRPQARLLTNPAWTHSVGYEPLPEHRRIKGIRFDAYGRVSVDEVMRARPGVVAAVEALLFAMLEQAGLEPTRPSADR